MKSKLLNSFSNPKVVLFLILLIKLILLALNPPFYGGDSKGYYQFSQLFDGDYTWLKEVDFSTSTLPIHTYRVLGYPVLIKLTRVLFGHNWDYALVLLQITLSMVFYWLLFKTLVSLKVSPIFSGIVTVVQSLIISLSVDHCIMTDSIFSSLFGSTILLILLGINKTHRSFWIEIGIGVVYATCLLVREMGIHLLPVLALGYLTVFPFKKAIARAALFCFPVVLVFALYNQWNFNRSGKHFFTLGTATSFMAPMVLGKIESFAENTKFDAMARARIKNYTFHDALGMLDAYKAQEKISGVELDNIVISRYKKSLQQHPIGHLAYTLKNATKAFTWVLNPVKGMSMVMGLDGLGVTKPFRPPSTSDKSLSKWAWFLLMAGPSMAVSVVLCFVCFGGVLVWSFSCLRLRKLDTGFLISLWLMAIFWALLLLYSLINMEPRYLAPSVPPISLALVLVINKFKKSKPPAPQQ